MSDIAVLYMTDRDDLKTHLKELGIDDANMREFLQIASLAFRVTYASPRNRRIFDDAMAERMKTVDVVYGALLSMAEGMTGKMKDLMASDGIIYAGASVDWESVKRVAEHSQTYADLLKRLDETEQKCMRMDRNSIRRRDLQESYEYLDGEIERLDSLLKGVALTRNPR